jgi:serine/threonine protein kinase
VRILEKIGQGQCAEVYKARWRGMFAVAKALKRPGDYKAGWTLATARADLVHEITVLSHLRHPNLVLFLGACIDHQNVVLLNEYMDGVL